jgi:putative ABC transport system ATP-binding protein
VADGAVLRVASGFATLIAETQADFPAGWGVRIARTITYEVNDTASLVAVGLAVPRRIRADRLVRTRCGVQSVSMSHDHLDDRREPAARAVDLTKLYGTGDGTVHALAGVNVEFERGRFTAVMGPSGSGKSTLMHCLAGLDVPTSGRTFVGDQEIGRLDDAALTELRRDRIGFVFQSFNLIATLSAAENITLPLDLAGVKVDPAWFDHLVDALGMADRLSHRPGEMSGGQQQRVACARALIGHPDLVFADEPTGNLDSSSSAELLGFLRDAVTEHGQSIVMVTHDPIAAGYADRVVFLADGQVVGELASPTADLVLAQMTKLRGRR